MHQITRPRVTITLHYDRVDIIGAKNENSTEEVSDSNEKKRSTRKEVVTTSDLPG